ncbi:MAG: non-canonical purine NTP pyrophosphatase, partial [Firmicutes bacterium]|nr:non-canonical purine NTP pyrophosphatase [Bacillota bacterium]
PAIAEDSGLEIDYLGGAPGVYSSRYMGEDTPYSQKNAAILMLMMAASDEKRTARYVSVFAAAFPDGRLILARDTIEGVIGREAKGTGGFGYDPIFFVPELGKSLAEISLDEKNKISHRGKSLKKLRELLRAEIEGLE